VKRQRERTQQHGDQTFKSESTSDTKQKLKDEINDLADAIIKEKAPRPYTQRSWQDTRKAVWYAAKAACGIDQGLTLAKINDLRVLQRLRDYFKSIR
jgi:hypothetical protein